VCAQVFQDRGHHVVELTRGLTAEELTTELPKYDGIVIRSSTNLGKEAFDACPNLKVSQHCLSVQAVHRLLEAWRTATSPARKLPFEPPPLCPAPLRRLWDVPESVWTTLTAWRRPARE
jgi:hypothetical protein